MKILQKGIYSLVVQEGGRTLGFATSNGARIIERDGCFFKNFSGDGVLHPYEDWRLTPEERAADLASRLSIEQIAGLMLYSNHQTLPATTYDISTYGGKKYEESGASASDISDNQKKFLVEDNLRHILVITIESPIVAAEWNNKIQAFCETLGFGIPVNTSSDPRHSARADGEFNAGGGNAISMWPGQLGLAATFSPDVVHDFARIASREYRLMGFTTALSPQADLCTDPRWYRCSGTFGISPNLAADMTRAYCDGFQSSEGECELNNGWGYESVNAMVKHWPGGGPCESGRDAHYGNGKFAVYPSNNFETHKIPFLKGAFALDGKTKMASAVMPYYTISYNQTDENVANAFNRDIITRQLRGDVGYDGVVCTDWLVTADEVHPGVHSGKPWGVESLTVAQRHYKALMAGVDQFGGNKDAGPVIEAYKIGVVEHGKEWMDARMRQSAKRLLLNFFRLGLFDNPYIDIDAAKTTIGCREFMQHGREAQVKSIVMLKNHASTLPVVGRKKVYIPKGIIPEHKNFWGSVIPEAVRATVAEETLSRYYIPTSSPEDADFAIVFIDSPSSVIGYSFDDLHAGGNGYIPLSLQYRPYTASSARQESIAGGDPHEDFVNRSYKGKATTTFNEPDLDLVIDTKRKMGDKPVITVVKVNNPFVISELEPYSDAILLTFDVCNSATLDIISGQSEPSALLPFQMPRDMEAVESHCEDAIGDIAPYIDSEGNAYDFAFGLNWSGVIDDERVKQYRIKN